MKIILIMCTIVHRASLRWTGGTAAAAASAAAAAASAAAAAAAAADLRKYSMTLLVLSDVDIFNNKYVM